MAGLNPDVVLVQLGDGALVTGVGSWLKANSPATRVVGVTARNAPTMADSVAAGTPVERDKPLPACQDKNAAVRWPLPIDYRLDQLVTRSGDVGERTSRKELLAALVLAATDDPEELSRMVRRFRMSKAGDALLRDDVERDGNVLKFPRHRPGPR